LFGVVGGGGDIKDPPTKLVARRSFCVWEVITTSWPPELAANVLASVQVKFWFVSAYVDCASSASMKPVKLVVSQGIEVAA
jgi:hypothetical protein